MELVWKRISRIYTLCLLLSNGELKTCVISMTKKKKNHVLAELAVSNKKELQNSVVVQYRKLVRSVW